MLADIREKVSELKSAYCLSPAESPKKGNSLSFIERSTVMESFRENSFIHPQQEEEEEIEDIEDIQQERQR